MNASESALLQSSLASVKQRFEAAADPISPSRAWLMHVHIKGDGTPAIYALVGDMIDSFNWGASDPFQYLPPPLRWNLGVAAIGRRFPPFRREVRIKCSERLTPICVDAATLLTGLPADVASRLWRGVPVGTELKMGAGLPIWALAVFELANAIVVGSSLRVARQAPTTEEQAKTFFAPEFKLPSDADWYAMLPDFAAASAQAIDILQSWLADELRRETEANSESHSDGPFCVVRLDEAQQFGERVKAVHAKLAKAITAIRKTATTSEAWLDNLQRPGLMLRDYLEHGPRTNEKILREIADADDGNLIEVKCLDGECKSAHQTVLAVAEFIGIQFNEAREWELRRVPEETRLAEIHDLQRLLEDFNNEDLAARLDTEVSALMRLLAKPVEPQAGTLADGDGAVGGQGEADGKPAKRQRGRRKGVPASDAKLDQRIADAWASGQYASQEELATAFGITKPDVVAALDRHRKRQA